MEVIEKKIPSNVKLLNVIGLYKDEIFTKNKKLFLQCVIVTLILP